MLLLHIHKGWFHGHGKTRHSNLLLQLGDDKLGKDNNKVPPLLLLSFMVTICFLALSSLAPLPLTKLTPLLLCHLHPCPLPTLSHTQCYSHLRLCCCHLTTIHLWMSLSSTPCSHHWSPLRTCCVACCICHQPGQSCGASARESSCPTLADCLQ